MIRKLPKLRLDLFRWRLTVGPYVGTCLDGVWRKSLRLDLFSERLEKVPSYTWTSTVGVGPYVWTCSVIFGQYGYVWTCLAGGWRRSPYWRRACLRLAATLGAEEAVAETRSGYRLINCIHVLLDNTLYTYNLDNLDKMA